MSYCPNPSCPAPQNPDVDHCGFCGSLLVLGDRFRLLKAIGQGGWGRTFLAQLDGEDQPFVVIKQFLPHQNDALQQGKRLFQQEAIWLQELGQHPQIPALVDYFEQDDRLYLVQEWIEGVSLDSLQEVFTEAQIWQVLDQLLPVLKFIHDRRVIHRDLKPANLIRRSDGRLVLVDFGAAKRVEAIDPLQRGTSIGSPEYVAPEQAKGKAVFASDLYSLGVTCVHLLTDTPPFDLFDVITDRWAWRTHLPYPVSDRLAQILDRLLEPVSLRFQSADEAIAAMEKTPRQIVRPQPPQQPWHCVHTFTGSPGTAASVNAVAIAPDGKTLVSGDDKTIKLWDLTDYQLLETLSGHSGGIQAVALNDTILVSGGKDKTIAVWNLQTRQVRHRLTGHSGAVKAIALRPDGLLASGSADKTIKLWDSEDAEPKERCSIAAHALQVTALTLSSHLLASASLDRTVQVWHLSPDLTPQLRYRFSGHTRAVLSIALSPDGNLLASGSDDNTIKIWNLKTGELMRTIADHAWAVVALAFAADGTLISGSWDKTIKLWNPLTGDVLATLSGHTDSVLSIASDPSGNLIASGSKDKTIKLWRRGS